jgi:rsbT antagonist protein RsbS
MARTIPIIRFYGNLLVSIQMELSDALILELKDDLTREIRATDVHGVVIEISGLDVFDSFVARSIQDLAQLARLMGVQTVVAGVNAGMAITLIEMGMELRGVYTALNLEAALERLAALRKDAAEGEAVFVDGVDDELALLVESSDGP